MTTHLDELNELQRIAKDDSVTLFNPECVRKKSNWAKSANAYKFDSEDFSPEQLLAEIKGQSPKLQALLDKIEALDKADMRKDGHLYKHFIFCDMKSASYGAKLLASALIAKGMTMAYNAPKVVTKKAESPSPQEKPKKKVKVVSSLPKSPPKKKVREDTPRPNTLSPGLDERFENPLSAVGEGSEDEVGSEEEEEEQEEEAKADAGSDQEEEVGSEELGSEQEEEEEEELGSDENQGSVSPSMGGAPKKDKKQDKKQEKKKAPKKKKLYGKLVISDTADLAQTQNQNFYLLSSVAVFDQPISVANKKQILKNFNERPNNIHGENIRFIIMDSGFKEGIDLFDIKYIHIFEPPVNMADQKQVIGRGTRTCGQKGLVFHPTQGWPLYVFIYDLGIPEKMRSQFLRADSAFDLYLKALNLDIRLFKFAAALEETAIFGSVDYELNRKIHEFGNASRDANASFGTDANASFGGGPKRAVIPKKPRLVIDRTLPPIIADTRSDIMTLGLGNETGPGEQQLQVRLPSGQMIPGREMTPMNFEQMREYVRVFFKDMAWTDVKMENMCGYAGKTEGQAKVEGEGQAKVEDVEKESMGGASELLNYTPTQKFISRFFTPQVPLKGMLLWQSVGTGKSCTAIATASSSFEQQGYTILWVTRTTLKNDIWKNMFDQICNEQIRRMVQDGVVLPEEHAKRMRLLSKAWRIRPMSYKQFSNLVAKENNIYKTLTSINGQADPLRKTLLIIDEAHKLYGGGDLSSLERPDMTALHQAVMQSYAISGIDSVRLLLMTATPITENPMELIKLVNLCRPVQEQMPDEFPVFSAQFLDEEGAFTAAGRREFLDNIAGNLSYLNRERDARQFAQPHIEHIVVPIVRDAQDAIDMDKRLSRSLLNQEVDELKSKIMLEQKKIDGELKDLDPLRFRGLLDRCDKYEGEKKKMKVCTKVAKANIRALVKEARGHTKVIRATMKEIRGEIKNKNLYRSTAMKAIGERHASDPVALQKFKKSAYYTLRYKCGKKVKPDAAIKAMSVEHPDIARLNAEIAAFDQHISGLDERVVLAKKGLQSRIKSIKTMMRSSTINDLEKSVLKLTIKDLRKEGNRTQKEMKKNATLEKKALNKTRRDLEKQRKKGLASLKKEVKKMAKTKKAEIRAVEKAEKKLRKTMRKQGELKDEFQEGVLLDLMNKYGPKIDEDMEGVGADIEAKEEAKAQAKTEKKAVKDAIKQDQREEKAMIKAELKEMKRQVNETRKNKEKADKALAKALIKAEKDAEKEREKLRKAAEKAAKKAENATKKNRKG